MGMEMYFAGVFFLSLSFFRFYIFYFSLLWSCFCLGVLDRSDGWRFVFLIDISRLNFCYLAFCYFLFGFGRARVMHDES